MRRFLILILLLSFTTLNFSSGSTSGHRKNSPEYISVTKVVDGDTFWVEDGTSGPIKIRLIGVDAPESRKTGKKELGYFGEVTKEYVTKLLKGKKVKLEFDIGRYDRYRRTLAYVYLEDGIFLNAELVKQGYAMVMTVPPNVKHAELFVKLQQDARKNNRGLWK